jgi:hypothetical protein
LFVVVHVDEERLCLRTAATNGPVVHSPGDISVESYGGMILTVENRRTRGETCPSAPLSITNPTWIDQSANPGLRGERPARAMARPNVFLEQYYFLF